MNSMIKRTLSKIILFILIAVNIFGCGTTKTAKTITADTPYYSVTTGSFERDRNVYMALDIKIPKITYSGEATDELMDSLNAEIESNLTSLIDEAKNRASNTFETYLQSAKDNAKRDIENKLSELENKYQSVLGKEEKDLLSRLTADDIINYSFSNMGRRNTFSNLISSYSETFPNFKRGFNPNNNFSKDNTEETVSGHTNTDELIIPGLHNKNIIVVETTTAAPTETSLKISGRPGIAPSEGSETFVGRPPRASLSELPPREFPDKLYRKATASATQKQNESSDKNINQRKTVLPSTKSEVDVKTEPFDKNIEQRKETSQATKSNTDVKDEITLENFYKDLRRIRRFNIPDDYSLAIQYIPTTIECDYELKCLDEDYLSLFVEITESRTTSSIKRLFYNVDLSKKKIVSLKDVLGDKYKEIAIKSISETIDKWSDKQKETLVDNYNIDNYISETTPFFINNNHRPVIEIEKFAITIGSTGYHEFQIP